MCLHTNPYAVALHFVTQYNDPESGRAYVIRPESYTDKTTGVTHIYARQIVGGIEFTNAHVNLNIRDGRVLNFSDSVRPLAPSLHTAFIHPHANYCAWLSSLSSHPPPHSSSSTQSHLGSHGYAKVREGIATLDHLHFSDCASVPSVGSFGQVDLNIDRRGPLLAFFTSALQENHPELSSALYNAEEHTSNIVLTPEPTWSVTIRHRSAEDSDKAPMEAQRRDQAEMVAMVADDRLLTFEDRSSMPYLEVTLQESLRRHSALLAPVVLGLLIGAMFVQWASFHWVFWFVGIIAIPVALACLSIIPLEIAKSEDKSDARIAKWKRLDLIGVSILTVTIILFIFTLTSGSADGGLHYFHDSVAKYISLVRHLDRNPHASHRPKWLILTGLSMLVVATTLLALGGGQPDQYWSYVFPAFALGSGGAMLTYTHTNIAIFQVAPASMAGTVGAMLNGALQFGSAIGLAAVGSIETSVEATHGGPEEYYGRAAAFWFLLAIILLEIISVSCLYQRNTDHLPQPKFDGDNTAVEQSKEKADEINDVDHGSKPMKEEASNSPV
ncbi:hypothetical protein PAXINDRAFT_15560 [Paxillus involutus ATCC 200175]|uniref:FTP domain-containing protein n=1 Tax=Paxillus involutus ATCC 200175 TaxID=664439 RepID=A0A0C9SSW3_PAXIN|nr:hypothetical protein PAXINDRAFT_15560 [Paxillus involutus ATCC 200175]